MTALNVPPVPNIHIHANINPTHATFKNRSRFSKICILTLKVILFTSGAYNNHIQHNKYII